MAAPHVCLQLQELTLNLRVTHQSGKDAHLTPFRIVPHLQGAAIVIEHTTLLTFRQLRFLLTLPFCQHHKLLEHLSHRVFAFAVHVQVQAKGAFLFAFTFVEAIAGSAFLVIFSLRLRKTGNELQG